MLKKKFSKEHNEEKGTHLIAFVSFIWCDYARYKFISPGLFISISALFYSFSLRSLVLVWFSAKCLISSIDDEDSDTFGREKLYGINQFYEMKLLKETHFSSRLNGASSLFLQLANHLMNHLKIFPFLDRFFLLHFVFYKKTYKFYRKVHRFINWRRVLIKFSQSNRSGCIERKKRQTTNALTVTYCW